jgi:hypothetical protein
MPPLIPSHDRLSDPTACVFTFVVMHYIGQVLFYRMESVLKLERLLEIC